MKDTTLKKVAEAAGVSHTTVSLVVNNVGGSRVSPKTRKRVLNAIRKLDYNPNLTAKRLASGNQFHRKATVTSRIIKGYKRALADDEINIVKELFLKFKKRFTMI